jgi:hypothetical protein
MVAVLVRVQNIGAVLVKQRRHLRNQTALVRTID